MKKGLLVWLIISISNALWAQDTASVQNRGFIVNIGDTLPGNLVFRLVNGEVKTLQQLRGKVVLLQFTASWCGVCRQEMPHLEHEIWRKYKDKGLTMMGVDFKESPDTVKRFARQMKITYPLSLDSDGSIFYRFAADGAGVTRNVVMDKEGRIVFLTRLYDKAEFAMLKNKIATLMAEDQ